MILGRFTVSSGIETIKENCELRLAARHRLQGNWLTPIIVSLIYTIIISLPNSISDIGWLIALIITGPMTLGQVRYFVKFRRGENPPVESLFEGFKQFLPAILLQLLITILVFLWSLLLIVPGIVAALGYSQAFYILNDKPEIEVLDALKQSKEMMKGYKGKLFMMWLSFIGWALLCILTLGIGFLWLNPYIQLSLANFYENLKATGK